MSLARLASLIGAAVPGDGANISVRGITIDSRRTQPADLFAALGGEYVHGADYLEQAADAGAVAVLTDEAGGQVAQRLGLPALVVPDPRSRVGDVAAEIYGHPAEHLLMLGVTGTNGKTTTTWLLEAGLRAAGHRTGLVGTVETQINGEAVETVGTTPEASELHALLAVMKERDVTAVAVEVSSHALAMGRIDGCLFDVVGFTSFGSDHLDFHPSIETYFAAKAKLFTSAHARRGVACVDSDGGQRLVAAATIPTQTVTTSGQPGDWRASQVTKHPGGGYRFQLLGKGRSQEARVQLSGRFNVANAALALAMLDTAGVSLTAASEGVADCSGVPGRMEPIRLGQDFMAIVDYAHTPDALTAVISSLRPETSGRVIVVVGCGGERDATKRSTMGEVAASAADVVVVTDDNPRSEDPAAIRRAVLSGTTVVPLGQRATVMEVPGRAQAIARAVSEAAPGDIVVVAGKGHETGQEIDGHVYAFDDRAVLVDAVRERMTVRGGVNDSGAAPEDQQRPEEER